MQTKIVDQNQKSYTENYTTKYPQQNCSFDIRDHLHNLTSDGGSETKREKSYHCPGCQAKNFKVNLSSGKYSTFSCHCAETEDGKRKIREAVAPLPKKTYTPPQYREWIYTDINGNPIAKAVRWDGVWDDKKQCYVKKVRRQYLVDGQWQWSLPKSWSKQEKQIFTDQIAPLYWDEIKAAKSKGNPIFICEGEATADAVRKLGLTATTFIGGTWSECYSKYFTGAKNVLCPDSDSHGIELMDQIANALKPVAESLQWFYVYPDRAYIWENALNRQGGGLDLKDYLEDYPMSAEDLFSQIEFARRRLEINYRDRDSTDQAKETLSPRQEIETLIEQYTQTTDEIEKALIESKLFQGYKIGRNRLEAIIANQSKNTTKPQARLLSPQEFFTAENTGIKWIVPGLVPVGGLTILAGSAGAGKTTLAYDCAASVIYGDNFLGEDANKLGNVLIVSSDEPLPFAQDKMLNRGIQDKFTFLDQWDISQWELLEETIDEVKPDLIIIDSFSAIHMDDDFDENSPTAKNTIYRFNRLLEQYGCGGILTHHLAKNKENKGVNKLRGSTAIGAAATMVWMLEGEGEVKRFHQPKTRGTEPLDLKVKLDPNTGIFNVVEGQIYDDQTKTLGDRIVALFESLEPNTRLEMQELLGYISVSQDAMYKALRRLTKRGVLLTRPSTKNKRSKVWGLASTDTPSPPTKVDCPMKAENTNNTDSQTLDTYWTDSGQTLDTLDSNNCPESETTDKTESQTLDRQLQLEGGVSQNNACPESKNEDENKKDIPVADGDIVTIKTLGGQAEAKVTEVRLGKKSKVIVCEVDGQKHITYPKDSDLISIADQWGNIKWKR